MTVKSLSHKKANRVIQTGVHVHLDYAIVNGSLDFLLGRARTTMEDEVTRTILHSEMHKRSILILTVVVQPFRRSGSWHTPGVFREVRGAVVRYPVCKRRVRFQTQQLC